MKEGSSASRAWAFDGGRIYPRGDWNVLAKPRRPIDAALDCCTKADRTKRQWVFDPHVTTLGSDWRSNNVVH
jgi:hypothetical protein